MKGKNLPQYLGKDGYYYVFLRDDRGKAHTKRVDILVAKAFVPNPDNKKYVRHKDGNKLNNEATNLEWTNEEVD